MLCGAELTNGLLLLTAEVSCLSPGYIWLYSSAVLFILWVQQETWHFFHLSLNWDLGGESWNACLGSSGLLGWLTACPWKPLGGRFLHLQMLLSCSGRDALWLCVVWLQLSPERPQCEPAQGPRPWRQTGRKAVPWRGALSLTVAAAEVAVEALAQACLGLGLMSDRLQSAALVHCWLGCSSC